MLAKTERARTSRCGENVMPNSTCTDNALKIPSVSIATCHAAKGLEWPVVFVPAVESGIFPSARSEDTEEERYAPLLPLIFAYVAKHCSYYTIYRRLLYVACTRAQALLYLTHSKTRRMAGQFMNKELSEFVSVVSESPKVRPLLHRE